MSHKKIEYSKKYRFQGRFYGPYELRHPVHALKGAVHSFPIFFKKVHSYFYLESTLEKGLNSAI